MNNHTIYDPLRNETWLEAFLVAIGFIIALIGFVGPVIGAMSTPGSLLVKFTVFLVGIAITGLGIGLIWASTKLQDKRFDKYYNRSS